MVYSILDRKVLRRRSSINAKVVLLGFLNRLIAMVVCQCMPNATYHVLVLALFFVWELPCIASYFSTISLP